MKRITVLLLLLCLVVSVVAGCDNGAMTTASQTEGNLGTTQGTQGTTQKIVTASELMQAFKNAGYTVGNNDEVTEEEAKSAFGLFPPEKIYSFITYRETADFEMSGGCNYYQFDSAFTAELAFGIALSAFNSEGAQFNEVKTANGAVATYTEGDADFGTIHRFVRVGNIIIYGMELYDIDTKGVSYDNGMTNILKSFGFEIQTHRSYERCVHFLCATRVCKPGSVLTAIYLDAQLLTRSSRLPGAVGQTICSSTALLRDRVYIVKPMLPWAGWALTPPFHPYVVNSRIQNAHFAANGKVHPVCGISSPHRTHLRWDSMGAQ